MTQSTNLQLTYLADGQAQKHVSVNESLRRLDAVVQLAVMSATTSAEPSSPSDGAVYILPAGKTGARWAAMTNLALAYYRDGAWEEIAPREGFVAYVKDVDEALIYTGATWAALSAAIRVSASDKLLGRISSGAGAAEEVTFTDQAQALCDDTSFAAMLTTLGAVAKAGDTLSGNLEISKVTPIVRLTDTSGPSTFSIFNLGGSLYVERPGGGNSLVVTNSSVEFGANALPSADNASNLGSSTRRYGVVYAATGTINTSDARDKTALRALSNAEKAAIRRVIASVGVFQWREAVDAKGVAGARLHVGVTAQAVQAAFAAEGLDATRYGLFCADDVDGELCLGVRMEQLTMMAVATLAEAVWRPAET